MKSLTLKQLVDTARALETSECHAWDMENSSTHEQKFVAFIPNYFIITRPLYDLTKQDKEWTWGTAEIKAMAKLKASLTSDQLMAYFDMNASTELVVDASPVGLAAILYQITGDKRRKSPTPVEFSLQ
ncbi:uncharacterized protein LOC121368555 [Gigantopelta aegis]|uniref:uncharacterized protein LOC121368555 n=1 Tax=Gigantopelta aegis TaxID=1735272 RepID=UPI001B888F4C|nr:uncharacterized protein LOC121368555 [Gigantopelta aegis]